MNVKLLIEKQKTAQRRLQLLQMIEKVWTANPDAVTTVVKNAMDNTTAIKTIRDMRSDAASMVDKLEEIIESIPLPEDIARCFPAPSNSLADLPCPITQKGRSNTDG